MVHWPDFELNAGRTSVQDCKVRGVKTYQENWLSNGNEVKSKGQSAADGLAHHKIWQLQHLRW